MWNTLSTRLFSFKLQKHFCKNIHFMLSYVFYFKRKVFSFFAKSYSNNLRQSIKGNLHTFITISITTRYGTRLLLCACAKSNSRTPLNTEWEVACTIGRKKISRLHAPRCQKAFKRLCKQHPINKCHS